MKNFFFLFLTPFGFFTYVNGQVPPPLGPPEVPANATSSELSVSLFIDKVKENLQTAVAKINRAIDSMSSSTGVNASISHSVSVRTPMMTWSTNSQAQNSKYARVAFDVTYYISSVRYHSIPYFSRKLFQDVSLVFSCNQWFTGNGSALVTVSAQRPVLDDASFGEQALNFFFRNTFTDLVDRKLKEIVSGVGGTASVPFSTVKCNCFSLTPGTPPGFTSSAVRFAYVPPKRIHPLGNNLTIVLKSIKRLKIIDLPDPVEESVNLEFHANHKSIFVPVSGIEANEVQTLGNAVISTTRPADTDMLVLIGNITAAGGGETFSNSMVLKKDKNFGIGTQKFIVVRSFIKTPLPGPDGKPRKPYVVYRPQYEVTVQISGDGAAMGMGQ